MKRDRTKQILAAAAELPPAKARALVSAIAGKMPETRDQKPEEDLLSDAALLMQAAMVEAALNALEKQS